MNKRSLPVLHSPLFWLTLAALAVYAVFAFRQDITAVSDPDHWMRLLLVTDLQESGGWYDHSVPRVNPPYGDTNHWSRALDIVLLALATPARLFLPFRDALLFAAQWLNLLLLVAALPALMMVAREMGGGSPARYFILLGAVCFVPFFLVFQAGEADNPPLTAMCLCWQLLACIRLGNRLDNTRMAYYSGMLGAIGVWISVEYIMAAGLALAWAAFLWLRFDTIRPLRAMAFSTFLMLAVLLCVELPLSRWGSVEHDSLSIVHVTLFGLAFATTCLLSVAAPHIKTPASRLALGGVAGCVVLLAMHGLFPGFHKGPLASITPEMQRMFLVNVTEMQPVYQDASLWKIAGWLVGLLALPYLIYRASGKRQQENMLLLGLFFAVYTVLFIFQTRWVNYMAIPHLLALALWVDALAKRSRSPVITACMMVTLAALPFFLLAQAARSKEASAQDKTCQKALNALIREDYFSTAQPGKTLLVLTRANDGAYLLFWTRHAILASNYHRNLAGYRDLYRFLHAADADTAREIAARRHIDMLVFCPAQKTEKPFLSLLLSGAVPEWLSEVPQPWAKDGVRLFTVNAEKLKAEKLILNPVLDTEY